MGEGAVGIGAGQQHEHVGPGGEGAPRLDAVDHPPAVDRCGGRDDAGHVGPEVGLRDGDCGQDLGRGQLGQPLLFLLLGPAVDECAGQDLGPRDERPADPQGAPAQLLGGDDHAHVVALSTRREAVVFLGDGEPEAAELGQALDDLLGDVQILAVHVLRVGADLLLGEAVERLAHQLEVLAQMARAFRCRQSRQHRRIALFAEEGCGRRVPAGLDPPQRFPARHAADEVGHDVGDERRGYAGLDLSQCAVLQRGPRRGHGGGGMRDVVRDDLVVVDAATRPYRLAGSVHQALGQINRVSGAGEVRCRRRRHVQRP